MNADFIRTSEILLNVMQLKIFLVAVLHNSLLVSFNHK